MIGEISVCPWWAEGEMLRGRLTIEDIIDRTAAMGVEAIDVQEIYLGLSPNPDPSRMRQIRLRIAARGLNVSSCWFDSHLLALAGLYSVDSVVEHLTRYLAIAESFNAKYLVVQNGEPAPGVTSAEARGQLMAVYERVAPLAEDHGITLCIEAARSFSEFQSPLGALALIRDLDSPSVRLAPDFEAWRIPQDYMPSAYIGHDGPTHEPLSIDAFRECLPYAPYVHAKLMEFDDNGTDPNYPVDDLMRETQGSPLQHDVLLEYEGWVPEVFPDRDAETETRKGVELIRSYRVDEDVATTGLIR